MTESGALNAQDKATPHLGGDGLGVVAGDDDWEHQYKMLKMMKLKRDCYAEGSDKWNTYTAILQHSDELDDVRDEVLEGIFPISSSSPEAAHLADICGTRNKFKQAEFLAQLVYDKQRSELALSFYTPSKEKVRDGFIAATERSTAARAKNVARVKDEIETKKKITANVGAWLRTLTSGTTASA